MTKPLVERIARFLTGFYCLFALTMYFGTLGSEAHAWWPAPLIFIIFPIAIPFHAATTFIFGALYPGTGPEASYELLDYITGAFYIVGGTAWVWFLVRLIGRLLLRLTSRRALPL